MGVGAGLYAYMCDVVVKGSRSLSHLLMSSCLKITIMLVCYIHVRKRCQSQANCHARLSHLKHSYQKHSSSDVSIIWRTLRKDIYIGQAKKNPERPTVGNCSNKKERRRDKTPAHTIDIYSVTDGILSVSQSYISLLLVDPTNKVNEAYYRNVTLLY